MSETTENFCLSLGIAPHIVGFAALSTALDLLAEDADLIHHMTGVNGLYAKVGQIIGKTPTRTERAIRYAIECYYIEQIPRPPFDTLTTVCKSKPTNQRFRLVCWRWREKDIRAQKSSLKLRLPNNP